MAEIPQNPPKSSDKPKAPMRMPQRSEAVAGDEAKKMTPIAAAQLKKPAKPAKSH